MTTILALLAAVGLMIASYFTAVRYRWVAPDVRWIPTFCRMDDKTCASVVFTPSAQVFGPPNSLFGQIYYTALLVAVALDAFGDLLVWQAFVAASIVTVGLALYLGYALLVVLRVPCPLCFTSHGINTVICGLLLLTPPAG